jgi:hypothetical protein
LRIFASAGRRGTEPAAVVSPCDAKPSCPRVHQTKPRSGATADAPPNGPPCPEGGLGQRDTGGAAAKSSILVIGRSSPLVPRAVFALGGGLEGAGLPRGCASLGSLNGSTPPMVPSPLQTKRLRAGVDAEPLVSMRSQRGLGWWPRPSKDSRAAREKESRRAQGHDVVTFSGRGEWRACTAEWSFRPEATTVVY